MTVILRDSFLMTDKNDPNVLFLSIQNTLCFRRNCKNFEIHRSEMVDILVNMGLRVFPTSKRRD